MSEKNWDYYKRQFEEEGIVLKYEGDCGCAECQITYRWIADGAPGLLTVERWDELTKRRGMT